MGHGQLLLRSTKSPARATQVDVLFKDVVAIQLPSSLMDLEVLERDELEPYQQKTVDRKGRRVFDVRGRGIEGYVVAGAVFHDEGDHSHNSPSPLVPPVPSTAH